MRVFNACSWKAVLADKIWSPGTPSLLICWSNCLLLRGSAASAGILCEERRSTRLRSLAGSLWLSDSAGARLPTRLLRGHM